MTEHNPKKPLASSDEQPDSVKKQQLKHPIDLSSERIGLDNNNPAVLPIGTGGVPPEAK